LTTTYVTTIDELKTQLGALQAFGERRYQRRKDNGMDIEFQDALFGCGCLAQRADPTDEVTFVPCSRKHEEIAIRGNWPAISQ
jgi:hypothetical protein